MPCERARRTRTAIALGLLALAGAGLRAETLPIRTYTTADGLPRNGVQKIVTDSRGFLWVLTPEGLSRFDGYGFVNFGVEDGLPPRTVTDLLETRSGTMWAATTRGLYSFDPSAVPPAPAFTRCESESAGAVDRASVLFEDSAGALWAGTADAGFYRFEARAGGCVLFRDRAVSAAIPPFAGVVTSVLENRDGSFWIGAGSGLIRRFPDGTAEWFGTQDGLPSNDIRDLVRDRAGTIWVATAAGACTLVPDPRAGRSIVSRVYTVADGLGSMPLFSMLVTRDGALWVGTTEGVSVSIPGTSPKSPLFRTYSAAHGLSDRQVNSLREDLEGNLWMGTESGGVMRLARRGFTSFGRADGIEDTRISSLFEDRAGGLCVASGPGSVYVNRFDGARFTAVRPKVPSSIRTTGWGTQQITFQDHTGDWWFPTGEGVVRYPPVRSVEELGRARPKAIYSGRDGVRPEQVFRLYEDSRGDVWIATITPGGGLHRWERKSERIHRYAEGDGVPNESATAFAEDANGTLWVGFYGSGMGRFQAGRLRLFTPSEGAPKDFIFSLLPDSQGRLWAATGREGLIRVDHPGAESPDFRRYTTREGLSSNHIRCLVEDARGSIYAATPLGVDRLEPGTGRVKHFTAADGITNTEFQCCFRDRRGDLWFGSLQGLSRLVPSPDARAPASPVWIRGIRVAGEPYPMPRLGSPRIEGLRVGAGQRRIEIEFAGRSFAPGGPLQYEYLLEGAGSEWSLPSLRRSVDFANLSPGRYRFLVRAVALDGLPGPDPAQVEFVVVPPVWRRWWFLAAASTLLAGAVYLAYRYRVERLLEVERVRTRIAMDLHDELGSGLGSIGVLAGISVEGGVSEDQRRGFAREIADTAHHLGTSLSDIVWSLRPQSGTLEALAYHIAERGGRLFPGGETRLTTAFPERWPEVSLSLAARRSVLLIAVEALHNAARHAGARRVELGLAPEGARWRLWVGDDGHGIPEDKLAGQGDGLGLASMRRRAEEIGAEIRWTSGPGQGTSVTLVFHPRAEDRRGRGLLRLT